MRILFNIRSLLTITVLLIMPLHASATSLTMQTAAKIQIRIVACELPRPLICEHNFSPVCGIFARNKPSKTFRNACLACKNPEVKAYERGKCQKDLKY
ncbi:hypothetical protein [Thiofilum flexile]|uniref:hypothetical protein n=1 Tax=Thiofilum flexile TaxID=125627 RepID=UPI000367472D|nr:hypothetical protein [Thiofilum flexile]